MWVYAYEYELVLMDDYNTNGHTQARRPLPVVGAQLTACLWSVP